ncbi:MAG: hypothetical protein WBK91_00355 [Alphaproteobacteria bacterium]
MTIVSQTQRCKLPALLLIFLLAGLPVAQAAEGRDACLAKAETDPDQALAQANVRLRLAPQDQSAMQCRALALFNSAEFLAAAMQFSRLARAVAQDKTAAVHYGKAAWAYVRAQQSGAAAQEFINAIERDPGNMQYRQDYAMALMDGEHYWDAVRELNHVVRRNSRAVAALALRADCWLRLGQRSRARADAIRALEIHPDEKLARAILDKIKLQSSDAEDAP